MSSCGWSSRRAQARLVAQAADLAGIGIELRVVAVFLARREKQLLQTYFEKRNVLSLVGFEERLDRRGCPRIIDDDEHCKPLGRAAQGVCAKQYMRMADVG